MSTKKKEETGGEKPPILEIDFSALPPSPPDRRLPPPPKDEVQQMLGDKGGATPHAPKETISAFDLETRKVANGAERVALHAVDVAELAEVAAKKHGWVVQPMLIAALLGGTCVALVEKVFVAFSETTDTTPAPASAPSVQPTPPTTQAPAVSDLATATPPSVNTDALRKELQGKLAQEMLSMRQDFSVVVADQVAEALDVRLADVQDTLWAQMMAIPRNPSDDEVVAGVYHRLLVDPAFVGEISEQMSTLSPPPAAAKVEDAPATASAVVLPEAATPTVAAASPSPPSPLEECVSQCVPDTAQFLKKLNPRLSEKKARVSAKARCATACKAALKQ